MAETADSVIVELIAKTDGYEARINGAASATDSSMSRIERSAVRAEGQVVRSAAAMANAQRNLGRQFADVGAQLSGGQSPFIIFAQQAPQIADALADTGGKAAKVAAFFSGPWGAALLAAGSVVGVLAGKLLETGEGLDALVAKLQENARKAEQADEAQRLYSQTLEGGAQAASELNEQLGKQIQTEAQAAAATLRSAEAQRTANIETRKRIVSQIALTRALLEQDAARTRQGGDRSDLAIGSYNRDQARLNQLKQDEAKATKAVGDAQAAVVKASIPILDGQAASAADANAAATDRHTKALGKLRDAYIKAKAAAKNDEQRSAAVRAYREGRTRIDVQLQRDQDTNRGSARSGRGSSRGPSADTLARRAERERIREVRNNEAYNNEVEQINGQILSSQRERAITAAEAAQFEREAVDSDYRKRREGIAADLSANKYTQAQADNLNQLNDYNRALRLRNVAINEDIRALQENTTRDLLTLDLQQQQLQADGQISESRKERQKIELELIALKYEERRIQLEALRQAAQIRGDVNGVNDTTEQINALAGLRRAEEVGVGQRYRGRYEQYRRDTSSADGLADSIDAIKVDTLERVTDELTKATTAALGLKGAFGEIVGEIIRLGIQRKLIGPLADSLFGKADGSTAGSIGSLLGSLFGRASGGYVAPNSMVRVNEGRSSGVELLRMGSQGGTVIPLGQSAAVPQSGGQRIFNISVDARNSVTPAGFAQDLSQRILTQAAQMDVDAGRATLRQTPGYVATSQRFGQPKTI